MQIRWAADRLSRSELIWKSIDRRYANNGSGIKMREKMISSADGLLSSFAGKGTGRSDPGEAHKCVLLFNVCLFMACDSLSLIPRLRRSAGLPSAAAGAARHRQTSKSELLPNSSSQLRDKQRIKRCAAARDCSNDAAGHVSPIAFHIWFADRCTLPHILVGFASGSRWQQDMLASLRWHS